MSAPIRITADEINILIYAYLQDSGFQHSAFAVRMESRLESHPYFNRHVPRGELIELLSKALLYIEVESHWRGDSLASNCKSGFSLLEPHVCSIDTPPAFKSPPNPNPASTKDPEPKTNGAPLDTGMKRKADTPSTDDGHVEKRTRRDTGEIGTDSPAPLPESEKLKPQDNTDTVADTTSAIDTTSKRLKPKSKTQVVAGSTTKSGAVRLLPGHTAEIFVCAWNPARPELLATGSKDSIVNIWTLPENSPNEHDLAQHPIERPLVLDYFAKPEQGDLTALHWNSEGTLLAIASYDSILRICTVTGALYFSHPQHQGPIFAVRFSKNDRWLLTASLDGTTCLWDVKEKRLHRQYRCHTDCCLDVEWFDDYTFGSCGADAMIHVMRIDESIPIKTLSGHQNEVNQIKCNPSHTRLASASDDMTTRLWNISNISSPTGDFIPGLTAAERVVVLEGHKHSVSGVGWCPYYPPGGNELLATSSFDGTTRIWDSVTGACLKLFTDHKRPVYALSFSPEGNWLASGSADGWLHVYNVMTKEKKWSWFAGDKKPGVFEIDWQRSGSINRLALALECRDAGVVDFTKIPSLQVL